MRPRRLVAWAAWLLATSSALAQPDPAAFLQAPRPKVALDAQTPALQPEPDCDAAFRSALGTCWTKGPLLTPDGACCTAMGKLTSSCWQAVAGNLTANTSDAAVKPTLERVLLSCNLTDRTLTKDTVHIQPSPYLTNGSSPAFPLVGELRTAWKLDGGPVPCQRYDADKQSWVLDPAAPTWGPSSSKAQPSDQQILDLANALCAQPNLAGAAMVQELAAGGERAQVLASALLRARCAYGTDLVQVLQSDPRLLNPVTALSYIEAFVRAADQVGVGACVTAAVLNSTGGVEAWAQLHTLAPGPPAANLSSSGGNTSNSGGGGNSNSSGGSGGPSAGTTSSAGDSSSEAPGDGSASSAGDSSSEAPVDGSASSAGDSSSEAPGNGSASSAGDSSSSEAPSKSAESSWVLTPAAAECSTFTPPYGWTDGAPIWAGKGGTEVPETAAEETANMLCEASPVVSGEALYAAFSQGGEAAEVAVAALLYYTCPSGDSDTVLDAAFRGFTLQDALEDVDTAYRVAANLVAAADAVGAGACVSLAVLDEKGGLVKQDQVHTSVDESTDGSSLTYSSRQLGGSRALRSRHQQPT